MPTSMFVWGKDGCIEQETGSLFEAISLAIQNNTGSLPDEPCSSGMQDDQFTMELMDNLFQGFAEYDLDCKWKVQNGVVMLR